MEKGFPPTIVRGLGLIFSLQWFLFEIFAVFYVLRASNFTPGEIQKSPGEIQITSGEIQITCGENTLPGLWARIPGLWARIPGGRARKMGENTRS